MRWGIEPDVDIQVLVTGAGPFDDPFTAPIVDVTRYLRGGGITIKRGRSDEFTSFQAGSCSFTLKNDNREFDPTRTVVALDLPGVAGSTASTSDHADLAPSGDLYVKARLSMDDWSPGGLGAIFVGQWPNVSGNNGWFFGASAAGNLVFSWTTAGTTTITRTSTAVTGFADGSTHWVDVLIDVNNGAAGHDVRFRTSEDGRTWTQLGTTITTAGTTSIFNSTAVLAVGDILPLAGQVYELDVRIGGMVGITAANPRFDAEPPGTRSFTDAAGRVWTVNGTAMVGYDDDASPFAAVLKPARLVIVQATYQSVQYPLFVGFIDGWPRGWTKSTGSVDIVAHDHTSVIARTQTSPSLGVLVLDHPDDGKLDRGRLSGDLPEQYSGERILSLLQLGGFGTRPETLQVDTGLTRVLEVEPTGNILGLVQAAEQAEAGFFFVSKQGRITFLDRHSRFQDTRIGDVQAVFTDSQYSALEVDHDLTQVSNDVAYTRPDGNEQRVVDDVSVHDYGYLSRRQEIPVVSDGETQARAEFWVDRYGRPQDRPAPIVISPRKNMAALFPKVAGRELLDRIQVERTPLGVAPTTTYTGLVESIEHRITNQSWATTLAISPIDVSEGDDFLVLDDATLGQINMHSLAY
jgi:hypothetical protein